MIIFGLNSGLYLDRLFIDDVKVVSLSILFSSRELACGQLILTRTLGCTVVYLLRLQVDSKFHLLLSLKFCVAFGKVITQHSCFCDRVILRFYI